MNILFRESWKFISYKPYLVRPKDVKYGQYIIKLSKLRDESAYQNLAKYHPDAMVNDKHFKRRVTDVLSIINGNFLTAHDIADDLHISLRQAHSFLGKSDKSYQHMYHIENVVKVHGINCDVNALYLPYHHGYIGKNPWQIAVSKQEYQDFINNVYSPSYSKHEQKLYKKYKGMTKVNLIQELMRMSRKLGPTHDNDTKQIHKTPSKMVNRMNQLNR